MTNDQTVETITEANNRADRNGTSIVTSTGRVVDILDPHREDIDLIDIIQGLAKQCRYNGQIPTFYSVAEHSVRVALKLREYGGDPLAGLLHDAPEAYIGDVVRPLKKIPVFEEVYSPIEERFEELISDIYGVDLKDPRIRDADMAVYHWEVAHIRTGNGVGMSHQEAAKAFASAFVLYSR